MPDDAPGGLYDDAHLADLRRGAAPRSHRSGGCRRAPRSTLTISENGDLSRTATRRRAAPVVLRVHRPGYQHPRREESELAWIEALRRARGWCEDPGSRWRRRRGGHLAAFELAAGASATSPPPRTCPGASPRRAPGSEDRVSPRSARIGARLHAHVPGGRGPGRVRAQGLGFEGHARRPAALGRLAGGARLEAATGAPCWSGRAPACATGWRRSAGGRRGSG